MSNEPKAPLSDEEREIAASGLPAPTTEEANRELGIIKDLLEKHGCPTTRDLVAAVSMVMDVAHKDAHSHTPDSVQAAAFEFVENVVLPVRSNLMEKAATFPTSEERSKWYARTASMLLYWARESAIHAILEARNIGQNPMPVGATDLNSDEQKKLLEMIVTSKFKN